MAKKQSKKKPKKQWKCPEGCKVTKNPCPHLEELLPPINGGGTKMLTYYPSTDSITESMYIYPDPPDEVKIDKFVKKCYKLGLNEYEIVLLVERLILKKSYHEIAKEHGFVDPRDVYALYVRTYKKAASYFRGGKQ